MRDQSLRVLFWLVIIELIVLSGSHFTSDDIFHFIEDQCAGYTSLTPQPEVM